MAKKKRKAFGYEIPADVKYTAYIVGDGRSRVFCPESVTQEQAEGYYQMQCGVDGMQGVPDNEPTCIFLVP